MATRLVPLFNERALVVEAPDERALVVGDLHLGLEAELRRKGVHGLDESADLVGHLDALARREAVDRVLLLGDVKHSLGAWDRLADVLAPLSGVSVPVTVVPGNHDGGLAELAPSLGMADARGVVVGEVGLLHGHTWPSDAVAATGRLVLCHNHPHVALRDSLGGVQSEPCWVRAPLTDRLQERYPDAPTGGEAVLVPAFNPLLGGVALNHPDQRALGPLLHNEVVDLDRGRVYTLDGVDLGTIETLRGWFDE